MKESSSLLKALDACETNDNGRCHVSSPGPQRTAAVNVDHAVLSNGARMTAASASCDASPDCDVEIISEKTVQSPVVEKNVSESNECMQVQRQGKLTARMTVNESKKSTAQTVQVSNECGIGSHTIVYSESPAVKQCSTEKIAVGTIGERINADGKKDKVIFNGTEWLSLRRSTNGACGEQGSTSDTRPGMSASPANQVTAAPSSSGRVADSKNPSSSESLGHRLWRHADTASINAASLRRPSLITLRPSIDSTSSCTGIPAIPGEPDRARLSCKASSSAPVRPGSSTSSGASAEGFYGKGKISDCPVVIRHMTGRGCQNGSPCRVSEASVAGPVLRSATPAVAPAGAASASVAKCTSTATPVANRSRVGVVVHSGASLSPGHRTATSGQQNKPSVGLAKRGRGRPRRQLPPTETVVLSSDEESDKVNAAQSPSKRRRLSSEADAVLVNADDDLFPCIALPNAQSGQRQTYSRRLVMQLPQHLRLRAVDLHGDRKHEHGEQWPGTGQSCPEADSFELHVIEVRVGTMACKPVNNLVQFSIKQGIRMSLYSGDGESVSIRIDGRDLIECVAHFSESLAAMFLSCKTALGNKLRQAFCMTDASQQYYDPFGKDEAQKYIVVIFDSGMIAEPTIQQRCVAKYFQELSKNYHQSREPLCTVVQLADATERLARLRPIAAPACSSARRVAGAAERSAHCTGSLSVQVPTSSARLGKRLASGEEQDHSPLIGIGPRRCARLSTAGSSFVQKRARRARSIDEPSVSNGESPVRSAVGADDVGSGGLQPGHFTSGLAVNSSARSLFVPSTDLHSPTRHSAGRHSKAVLPLDEEEDDDESGITASRSLCAGSLEHPGDRTCAAVPLDVQVAEMAEGHRRVCHPGRASMAAAGSDEKRSPMQWQPSVSSDSPSSEDSSHLPQTATARRSLRFLDGAQCTAAADGGSRAKRLLLYPYPPVMGSIAVTTGDIACLEEEEFLNDVIVDFYLKYLFEERLSPDNRRRTHVFSSFFYMRLMQSGRTRRPGEPQLSVKDRRHNGVKTWTRHVDLFDKDYLIVPINENSHWYLAVICFPSSIPAMFEALCNQPRTVNSSQDKPPNTEDKSTSAEVASDCERCGDTEAENTHDADLDDGGSICSGRTSPELPVDRTPRRPFIIIFDSLGGVSMRCTAIRVLREYLEVEWRTRKGPAELTGPLCKLFTKDSIPGWCPACPGQDNSCDCGIYLLQYVESFFEEPVMDCSMETSEHLRNWFPQERIKRKRQDIKDLLNSMHVSFMQPEQLSADG